MSITKSPRNPKGTVVVEIFRQRLRLRWRVAGKQYSLGIGLPDTKINRHVAMRKAAQIELDIASGHFDPTLRNYKPDTQNTQMMLVGSSHSRPQC